MIKNDAPQDTQTTESPALSSPARTNSTSHTEHATFSFGMGTESDRGASSLSDPLALVLIIALLCTFLSPRRPGRGRRVAVVLGMLTSGAVAGALSGCILWTLGASALGGLCATLGPSPRGARYGLLFGRSFRSGGHRPGMRQAMGRWVR